MKYNINNAIVEIEMYYDEYMGEHGVRFLYNGNEKFIALAVNEKEAEKMSDRLDEYLQGVTDGYAAEVERRGYDWTDEAQDAALDWGTPQEWYNMEQWKEG